MFAGLENVQANPRRGWTALVSFTLQAAAVAAALAIPLMYPNRLPDGLAPRRLFVPITGAGPENPPPTSRPPSGHSGFSLSAHPISVTPDVNSAAGRRTDADSGDISDGPPRLGFVAGGAGPNLGTSVAPVPRTAVAAPMRVSVAMQGYLIRRVEPRYPEIARTTRVEGAVLIKAVISTEGKIEQAQIISGSPLLSKAALDAIRQWRYRPYLLNEKPVEVETEITVNFYLTR
jgi:periplasmic protein TonB